MAYVLISMCWYAFLIVLIEHILLKVPGEYLVWCTDVIFDNWHWLQKSSISRAVDNYQLLYMYTSSLLQSVRLRLLSAVMTLSPWDSIPSSPHSHASRNIYFLYISVETGFNSHIPVIHTLFRAQLEPEASTSPWPLRKRISQPHPQRDFHYRQKQNPWVARVIFWY